jgi:hypothetical protein
MDRGLASPARRRTREAKRVTEDVPDGVEVEGIEEDEDAARPPAPHPVLDKLIGHSNGYKTMTINAAAVKRLLATNTGNRHMSQRRVAQLAAQMRGGHFENTGEPIIVSDEGILNNGQDRLLAVIEADAAVEMDLRFGIPRRAFDRWPDITDAAAKVQVYRFPPQIRSTPLYATTFLAMHAPRAVRVDDWLHVLATGLEAHREHPAYVLRERLLRGIGADLGTRERQLLRFALMIKSRNMFRQDESVSMRDFQWSNTGRDPEPFPRISGARLN